MKIEVLVREDVHYPTTSADRLMQAIEEDKIAQRNADAEAAQEQYHIATAVNKADNLTLIRELYERGVSIKDIFGRYFEFDAASDAQSLDVEDVRLAGLDSTFNPKAGF